MRRYASGAFAGLSLVAALLFIRAWAAGPWGYEGPQQRSIQVGRDTYFLASRGGGLRVVRQRVTGQSDGGTIAHGRRLGFLYRTRDRGFVSTTRFGPPEPDHQFLGFGWGGNEYTRNDLYYVPAGVRRDSFTLSAATWAVPYWPLVTLSAVPPALWLRGRLRAWRRRQLGQCPACGYDLLGSPDRCPECGTETPTWEATA